jgi:hypothetical protein
VPLKHRIILAIAVALTLIALAASPLLVADGVRAWIWWTARQQKLTAKIDMVEAPFLRPVVLHNVRLTSAPNAAFRIDLRAAQVSARLNFKRILLGTRERALRNATVSDLHVEIHRNPDGEFFGERVWSSWQKLLPDSAKIDKFDLRVENGAVVALVRGGAISFSEIEPGRFSANEVTIASPLVRQTFSRLNGGTRWQDNRLTLAGLGLTRGLDLQSITFDLSRLSKRHIATEFDLDAFGGNIRGDVSSDWRTQPPNWIVAASAANISLAQTAEAVGLADRVSGRLRAAKFTYRADPRDASLATASLWTELSAPAWRDRQADVLMLGASFYNRKIDIQQLYIKQRKNELTLSGDAPLPNKWSDWLTADFHADVSSAINDVADFANLFGGNRDQFHGAIAIEGTIDSHARNLSGDISAHGTSLKLFGWPVDLFELELNMADRIADIAQFNFRQKEDFLRVQGKIDMAGAQGLRGTVELAAKNLALYAPNFFPPLSCNARFDFNGRSATFDSLTFGASATAISLNGVADFSDPQKIDISMRPMTAMGFGPIAADCINRVELVLLPKNAPPLMNVTEIKMRGSIFAGISEMTLRTDGAEKTYRLFCPNEPNTTLSINLPAK